MKTKIVFLIFLIFLLTANTYRLLSVHDSYTQSKIKLSRFDGGISYLGRLNLWQSLVLSNDWEKAATLETKLDQTQISQYKADYQPQSLYTRLNQILNQSQKTADDYINIAKIYTLLDQTELSDDAIKKAHQLDPIRADIDRLFYQLP
ncbi:MAG TPA: hypothetical protein PKZ29_00890 [Candidatus Woesebacteria bacterium]|nr:hypothetical protein [Candidatus Woesebacteria bacterium]HOG37460.1 hypothetical protein [Candidatus Woesebacteria bacterium]